MKLSSVVIVAWICWIAMAEPLFCTCLRSLTRESTIIGGVVVNLLEPDTVRYTTNGEYLSYAKFMSELKYEMTYRSTKVIDTIPVLPSPRSPSDSYQYVYVQLTNAAGNATITLALNISSVDLIGYQAGETSYFYNTTSKRTRIALFPYAKQYEFLAFSGDYGSLEAAAGLSRTDIALGVGELDKQIKNLYSAGKDQTRAIAKALILITQMVCEAARSRYIQQRLNKIMQIHVHTPETFYLTDTMLEYERNWEQLSSMVQSASFGVFPKKVKIGSWVVEYVRQIVFYVPLLMPLSNNCASSWLPMRSLLESDTSSSSLLEGTCGGSMDPVVHIVGYNGLCMDVDKDDYADGNKVVLFDCDKDVANQIWTLSKKDQTIQSKGKCLAASGFAPSKYIMIYDCSKSNSDSIKWEVFSNGSIVNPKSGLHLTAKKDDKGKYNLILDNNFSGSRQSWYATNVTQPVETTIVSGENNWCLRWTQVIPCVHYIDEEYTMVWKIYPDGTIRDSQGQCLKSEGKDELSMKNCDGGSSERWLFQGDGTILHMNTQKVLSSVDNTDKDYVGLAHYDRNSISQIWFYGGKDENESFMK